MEWTYNEPASRWGEADPLGNGHMGAMVYGGIFTEQIDLSELTFFSGKESIKEDNQKGAYHAFRQMRKLAIQEDFEGVTNTAERFIGKRNNYGTNLPVGKLMIDIGKKQQYANYQRSLDFGCGSWSCSYVLDGGSKVKRESFLSWVDKVLVYRMKSEKPMDCRLWFQPGNEDGVGIYQEDGIQFCALARESMHSDGICGVNLYGRAMVHTDGKMVVDTDGIQLESAKEFCIYLTMETDFRSIKTSEQIKHDIEQHLYYCLKKGEKQIETEHQKDIFSYLERCIFSLESENDTDNQIVPRMFQYGRYLLLASSREDSKLPAHLQGIWNDNVACRIGWTCDMHLDINTQMNYWPANLTGLQECNIPLFRWIRNVLIPSGRITAKESYGLEGWVAEIVSNPWGFTAPYWATPIAPCPTGGVWILSHIWEHGWYTMDREFISQCALPVMREAAKFFLAYVFETKQGDGVYTCGPSISPENSFVKEGKTYQISNGCTYEIVMIRELFEQLVTMEQFLKVSSAEGERAKEVLPNLLPYRIRADGTLAEWSHEYPANDMQHRHQSHLLGLYPFSQITPEKTKELAEAAERTMGQRLEPEQNWEDTGWARAMMLLYAASLKNGTLAGKHLSRMRTTLLDKNHMIIHPPTRGAGSFANVYELDGNTGFTSGVANMLLQSNNNTIELLPAIPKEWVKGEVRGLRARGGFQVSFSWEDTKVTKIKINGPKGASCRLKYNGKIAEHVLGKEAFIALSEAKEADKHC